jgi:hypothetical protein
MQNSKYVFFLIVLSNLCSCKPSTVTFKAQSRLSQKTFWQQLGPVVKVPELQIDSIRVYKATLTEKLIERDRVPEYKLINEKSKSDRLKYEVKGFYHDLYIFRLFAKQEKNLVVFMGTSYDPNGVCIGLGPLYQGFWRQGRLNFFQELSLVKKSPFAISGRSDSIRTTFYYNTIDFSSGNELNVEQIIQSSKNKVAGSKPVIFDISKIFNDNLALLFSYDRTIFIAP